MKEKPWLFWILKQSRVFFWISISFEISNLLEISWVLKILRDKSNFSINERKARTVLDFKPIWNHSKVLITFSISSHYFYISILSIRICFSVQPPPAPPTKIVYIFLQFYLKLFFVLLFSGSTRNVLSFENIEWEKQLFHKWM